MSQILAQGKWPDGKITPWGNTLLGFSSYYVWAKGCTITELAEILGITPDVFNDKFKLVDGFALDINKQKALVNWSKIAEAFPGVTATKVPTYNNDAVLAELAGGASVLVEVPADPIGNPGGTHWVRYIGNHKLHDPWTGTERPTSDFPNPKSYVVITGTWQKEQPKPAPAPTPAGPEIYKGLDLSNKESIKAAIDAWSDVANGQYIKLVDHQNMLKEVCTALGIATNSDITAITTTITTLKTEFANQVAATVQPDPAVPAAPVTLKDISQSEKDALLSKVEAIFSDLKTHLGI